MDPKANIEEQLSLARAILVHGDNRDELDYAERLAELVLAQLLSTV